MLVSRYGGAVYWRNCARATLRLQQSSACVDMP